MQTAPTLDPLLAAEAPRYSAEGAEQLAFQQFGVTGSARLLTSERDQNFHLRTAEGREYVLKVANPAEDPEAIAFQNAVLTHIAEVDPELPTPRVVLARDGAASVCADGFIVRLLTWLPGRLMHQAPSSPALRHSLGATHARLGLAMAGVRHPGPSTPLMWDLQHAGKLYDLLTYVEESKRRGMVERGLARFSERAAPALQQLPKQVIHNDLNHHNVVVSERAEAVAGVIDFGDMVRAPRVCDVAVAASYLVRPGADVFADAADYLSAYMAVSPLNEPELAVLTDLVVTRLTMSALISTWRAGLYPDNSAYILRNAPAAWAGLEAVLDGYQTLELSA